MAQRGRLRIPTSPQHNPASSNRVIVSHSRVRQLLEILPICVNASFVHGELVFGGGRLYLYNLMPKDDCMAPTAPANVLYNYTVMIRGIDADWEDDVEEVNNPYCAGDEVWVQPHDVR